MSDERVNVCFMNEYVSYVTFIWVLGIALFVSWSPSDSQHTSGKHDSKQMICMICMTLLLLPYLPHHPTLLLHSSVMLLATGWSMSLWCLVLSPWIDCRPLQAPAYLITTLGLAAVLWDPSVRAPSHAASWSNTFHALLAVASASTLALTLLQALGALIQHMALKRSQPWDRLPSLATLQRDLHTWLWLSFTTLTLAMLLGLWAPHPDHPFKLHKMGFATAVWAVLAFVLFRFAHWRFQSRRLMHLLGGAAVLLAITYGMTWGEH